MVATSRAKATSSSGSSSASSAGRRRSSGTNSKSSSSSSSSFPSANGFITTAQSWASYSSTIAMSILEDHETWWLLLQISATAIAVIGVALAARLYCMFFNPSRVVPCAPHFKRHPLRIMVVLGSGGHTTEMIQSLQLLGSKWTEHRCTYIVSDNDKDSANAAKLFEQSVRRYATVRFIPRARNVGQSYVSSVRTTLVALSKCFSIVWEEQPDVILTNGPGVCIPVVFASLLINTVTAISLTSFWASSHKGEEKRARPTIAYFESFTCVDHLSLSGKILRSIADVFTVQWPQLLGSYDDASNSSKKKKGGNNNKAKPAFLVGPFANPSMLAAEMEERNEEAEAKAEAKAEEGAGGGNTAAGDGKKVAAHHHGHLSSPSSPPLRFLRPSNRVAMVTVGSTKFDDLIRQIPTRAFLRSLQRMKVTQLYVQKGRSEDGVLSYADAAAVRGDGAGGDTAPATKASGTTAASPNSPTPSLTAASTTSTEDSFIERALREHGITVEVFDYKPNLAGTFLKRSGGGIPHQMPSVFSSNATTPARTPTTMSPASMSPNGNNSTINSMNGGGGSSSPYSSSPLSPFVFTPTTVDLLISHAGAGTILEAFKYRIPTIVVPNNKLMNNHQLVFAEQLADRGYLVACANGATDADGGKTLGAAVDKIAEMCGGDEDEEGGSNNNTNEDVTDAPSEEGKDHVRKSLHVFPSPNAEIMRDLFAVLVGSGAHAHDGKRMRC